MNTSNVTKGKILLLLLVLCTAFVFALSEEDLSNISLTTEEENTTLVETNISVLNDSREPDTPLETIVEETRIDDSEVFEAVLEENTEKMTEHTVDVLASADSQEEQRVLIKYKRHFDKGKLEGFESRDSFEDFQVEAFTAKTGELSDIIADNNVELIEIDQDVVTLGDVVPAGVVATLAPTVWNNSVGAGIKVALLDTGIASHDDLLIAGGTSVVGGTYADTNGHGTAVAGIVAAVQNSDGLVGVAPEAELYAVKIMNGSSGQLSDALAGLEWAHENDMNIVVMSFGMEEYSEIFANALDDAYDDGMLLVAASGNDGSDEVLYPAAYSTVISVGAVNEENELASFSNYGSDLELVAFGVDVNTTSLTGYDIFDGTSFAAPHVAGVAALLWSYNLSLTNEEVRGLLRNSALDLGDIGRDDEFGYGLVQVDLGIENVTLGNDTYFYEIYNITDYDLENETLAFWLNGTGTIEDVDLAPGYYLVMKWLPEPTNTTIFVTTNGTIFLLVIDEGTLLYADDYSIEGNSSDGALWLNGAINATLNDDVAIALGLIDGECYYRQIGAPSNYDNCSFPTTTKRTDCDAETNLNLLNCGVATCTVEAVGQKKVNVFTTTVAAKYDKFADYFDLCGVAGDATWYRTVGQQVLVMNQKRSVCTDSAHYAYQGSYNGGVTWSTYVGPVACDGTCDNSLTQTTSTRSTVLTPPCISCSVTGTINVAVEADGSAYGGAHVLINDAEKGRTANETGALNNLSLTGVGCNADQEVEVRCSDNVTVCGVQTTQVDVNGDEDFLMFDCTLACGSGQDLTLSQSEVWVNTSSGKVTATISSKGVDGTNVLVNISRQDESGLIIDSAGVFVNITSGSKVNASAVFNLTNEDFIHIWADYTNVVPGEDNTNNYLFRPALKAVRAYVNISTDSKFSAVDNVIREYLASYLDVVDDPSNAQITIMVSQADSWRTKVMGPRGQLTKNYDAEIYRVRDVSTGKGVVYVRGLGIEGVVAGLKRLVSARNLYLISGNGTFPASYIDDYDLSGIRVMDQFGTAEARSYYSQPTSPGFAALMRAILFDNNFDIAILPVKTLNTTSYNQSTILRVKHLNNDFSAAYLDALGVSDTPVIFSGGIFSNLETWEGDNNDGLAAQLANTGRDVWEIEMNGGPTTDACATPGDCPDYTYNDQVDYTWPASIAGVLQYTGKSQADYVAHSNGCEVALGSLNNYSLSGKSNAGYYFDYTDGSYKSDDLPISPVRRFVGVACAQLTNGTSFFISRANSVKVGVANGDAAMSRLNETPHVLMADYGRWLLPTPHDDTSLIQDATYGVGVIGLYSQSKYRISYNLMSFYNHGALHGLNINVSKLNVTKFYLFASTPDDFIVPYGGVQSLLNNTVLIQNSDKNLTSTNRILFKTDHVSITSYPPLIAEIQRLLK